MAKPISASFPYSAASSTSRGDLPALRSGAGDGTSEPAVDRVADIDIPRRLLSAVQPTVGPPTVMRAPSDAERAALMRRIDELQPALRPFSADQTDAVAAEVAAMLSGFRTMRQMGEEASATVEITVRVLRDYPLWAIAKACLAIARGQAGLDRRYAPNDAEICSVVSAVLQPWRKALATAESLLAARPAPPPRSEEERERILSGLGALSSYLGGQPDPIAAKKQEAAEAAAERAERQHQRERVVRWNREVAVGARVAYRTDDGSVVETATRALAEVLGGHTAVVWLEGITGCVSLERVAAIVDEPAGNG